MSTGTAKGGEFAVVNKSPVTEAKFQDITVANDVTYRYLVRTVRQVGSGSLESLDSQIQTAKPGGPDAAGAGVKSGGGAHR